MTEPEDMRSSFLELSRSFDEAMAEALQWAATTAMTVAEAVNAYFSRLFEALPSIDEASKSVAAVEVDLLQIYADPTPRQLHLMLHGSPRVRKKWKSALWRKARRKGVIPRDTSTE